MGVCVHCFLGLVLLVTADAFCHAWCTMTVPKYTARRTPENVMMKEPDMSNSSPLSRRLVLAGAMAPALWFPESSVAKDTTSEIGRVQLGRGELGLLVPEMGVGAWSWGDSAVWGYGTDNGATSGSIEQAYRACLQSGVSLIDTAEVYGESNLSENILGKLIAETPVQERSKVQVATKFYPVDPKTNFPRSAADILPALDRSLGRLGLNSVDLYQIHNPGFLSGTAVGEALAEAVLSGRCKAVGVSNYGLNEIMPVYKALQRRSIPLASNQVEFSLLRQLPETGGLAKACHELGIGILAYSPLGMGRLTGKYTKRNKAPSGRFFGRVDDNQLDGLVAKMREIGAKHGGKSPAQVALNWVICNGAVPIPGAKNAKQAFENAGSLGWRLTGEEVLELSKLGKVGGTNIWQHDGSVL